MSLHETLQHRRAIRYYDPEKPLDSARVEECLRQATLAPTSSNMQLYRCYHITDPAVIAALTPACLGQSISTAKEVVVFAITPSRWRERVDHLFPRIVEDIHKHQPEEKWAKYEAMQREYMTKVVPFLYSRGCKVWGWARHLVMNAIALQDFLEKEGVHTRVQSAINMAQVAEPYIPRRAERHLEKGRLVIFGAGSGMPYFSTDTVAAQRALEIGAEVLLMGKQGVDGVYDSDPQTNPDAKRYEHLTHDEFLAQDLKVADATAIALARDNSLNIVFFNLSERGNIGRVVQGEPIGTLVSR